MSINERTSCLLDCIDALGAALPLRDLSRVSRTYKELIEENERTIEGLVIEDLDGGVLHVLKAALVVVLEDRKQPASHEAVKDTGEPPPAEEEANEGCSLVSGTSDCAFKQQMTDDTPRCIEKRRNQRHATLFFPIPEAKQDTGKDIASRSPWKLTY